MKKRTLGLAGAMWLAARRRCAFADVIDGNWCQADGRHLEIDGSTITTPGGNTIQGDYGRHTFTYTVPAVGTVRPEPPCTCGSSTRRR